MQSIHSNPQSRPPELPVSNTRSQAARESGARASGAEQPENPTAARRSASDNRQSALKLVDQTLAMGYEKLAAKQKSSAGEFARFEPLSAEKVAGNILGFIEARLQKDAAAGASQEALEERLEQGLAGFKKGFAQAQEKLEALSMLSPEVEEDIGQTRELVLDGIDQLRQRLLDGALEPARGDSSGRASESSGSRLLAYDYGQARATSFSFSMVTAEGDRVEIRAEDSRAASLQGSATGQTLSASASQSRSWSVSGSLNDSERSAIEQLIGEVDELAEQFFAGDLSGAMGSAESLGYDREQILGFSLNLSQSSIQRASETYKGVGQNAGRSQELPQGRDLQQQLAPLGQFARDLQQTLRDAQPISADAPGLVLDVAEQLASGEKADHVDAGQSLRDFMESLLAGLNTTD
ncbi:DUF5610 domain-containing protein [Marinimicrobium sp. C2-29]|uniref:DUF5610 domain-containing protein n=1 Tax=Marinimicrobium sp. C2-29 TaxID=3139825 RepID=UPI003139C70E